MWLRSPGMLLCSPGMLLCTFCLYQGARHGPESEATRHPVIAAATGVTIVANAQYYMQRVTGNAYRRNKVFSS